MVFLSSLVISGGKNDSGSEGRRGAERAREVHFSYSEFIFRLNCSQGLEQSVLSPAVMEEKRKRHFLYTWPTGAINKQAARPFANASQVHVRGR